jgi:type II secretory pathway predicted ATPase ExeA
MYERFFGLNARPFDLNPDPRYLVATDIHREALSNLEYGIASRKGITLLVGEAGTGKTTLIRAAIEKQSARTHCVHLQNPALTRGEFLRILAIQFGLSESARVWKADFLLELEHLLRSRHDSGEATVLIVDEAQSLPMDLLDEIRLLTNIETASEKLLPLVIAGQPEIAERLNEAPYRQLKQRIALRCELRPLALKETVRYIAGRIAAVGGSPAQVFTREAVALIHEYSQGIPRTINVLADNALLSGFATEQRPVLRQLVHDVSRDFDIGKRKGGIAPAPVPSAPRASHPISEAEEAMLDAVVSMRR